MKKPYQLASLFYPDTPKESFQGVGKLTAGKDRQFICSKIYFKNYQEM